MKNIKALGSRRLYLLLNPHINVPRVLEGPRCIVTVCSVVMGATVLRVVGHIECGRGFSGLVTGEWFEEGGRNLPLVQRH